MANPKNKCLFHQFDDEFNHGEFDEYDYELEDFRADFVDYAKGSRAVKALLEKEGRPATPGSNRFQLLLLSTFSIVVVIIVVVFNSCCHCGNDAAQERSEDGQGGCSFPSN